MPSTESLLKYLYGLERLGIKKGLGRIIAVTKGLGNPQGAYPCVHVAGTNGKGSTSAMIASILAAAGFRVGLYTSPHLDKFNERISISGRAITDAELVKTAVIVRKAVNKVAKKTNKKKSAVDEPSFFEFTTALAFRYFKDKKVDVAIFETGMGGRWDATNVVTPVASVITNIGLDHTAVLGKSLRAIAGEKAGIIKQDVPVITGEEKPSAFAVIRNAAKKKNARLYKANSDFSAYNTNTDKMTFDYRGIQKDFKDLRLSLFGGHQFANAALSLCALELLCEAGFQINKKAIARGLLAAKWPGRLEILRKKPRVIIDCAHNVHGAKVLKEALLEKKQGKLVLLLGIMRDKDVDGIVKTLAPIADIIIATQANIDRAEGADKLMAAIIKHATGKTVLVEDTIPRACKIALKIADKGDTVCVAGSIYTAAEARRCFLKQGKGAIEKL